MEGFRELRVRHGNTGIDIFIVGLQEALLPGWTWDGLMEEKLQPSLPTPTRCFCFTFEGDDRLPNATICLIEDEPGRLRLSSIVPRKQYQLTKAESDALLEEFTERILRPCAEKQGAHVTLRTVQDDLHQWLSEAAVSRFRRFSDGANRRAGYLLPIDRERWLEFLMTAHRERSKLDASTLRRWLIEVEGWSPEIADHLAVEYAFSGELLSFSESHRAGA